MANSSSIICLKHYILKSFFISCLFSYHKVLWHHHQLSLSHFVVEHWISLTVHYSNSSLSSNHVQEAVGVDVPVWSIYTILHRNIHINHIMEIYTLVKKLLVLCIPCREEHILH